MAAQLKIIENNKNKAKNPSIIVNDKMVKVHYDDRRLFYKKEWEKHLKSVDIY
ncbi:hypothetical protein HGB13_03875 [bacterium]|nr:hypothetical protein [bacterium]